MTTPYKGFSLIEVLVVVGVIAILASLMLPTITMVRELAKKTKCQSNMRQLSLAFGVFTQDNRGSFPNYAWQDGIHEYINTDAPLGWWGGVDGATWSFAHCPSAPHRQQNGNPLYVTYAYTAVSWDFGWKSGYRFFAKFPNYWNDSPEQIAQAKAYKVRLAQVVKPSEKCFLTENWSGWSSYWGENSYNDQSVRVMHRHTSNMIFADLRVQSIDLRGANNLRGGAYETEGDVAKFQQWEEDSAWIPLSDSPSVLIR